MKNSIKVLVMLTIIVMAGMAKAQGNTSNTNANITATVITPIVITKTNDMALGKILADAAVGTLTIAKNGTKTFSNSNNSWASNTAIAATSAKFHVTGDASSTFSTYNFGLGAGGDANGVWLSDGAANSMWFAFDAVQTGQTLGGGATDIQVAGVLSIGAAQPAGAYTGSFTETVTYE